jgi:hypothetical protein
LRIKSNPKTAILTFIARPRLIGPPRSVLTARRICAQNP